MRWIVSAALACGAIVTVHAEQHPEAPAAAIVTPVSGPSWLHTLGLDYRDTSLGRGAGRYGPDPAAAATMRDAVTLPVARTVTVTGRDLYRINCQLCHRAEGTGAPPEIKSLLPAIQGTTLPQMSGSVTRLDLYARLEKGGQKMPPRNHLQHSDIDVLYGYLTALAGAVPHTRPAEASEVVTIERLGENVVKGTCHICHDAAGPRPSDQALLEGAIPPLSVVMTDKTIAEFVNKVEHGAPAMMGSPPMPHRGRMPVFYYLTETEIAAAYQYLRAYAPRL